MSYVAIVVHTDTPFSDELGEVANIVEEIRNGAPITWVAAEDEASIRRWAGRIIGMQPCEPVDLSR